MSVLFAFYCNSPIFLPLTNIDIFSLQESNSNFKKLMIALAVADNLMIIDLMIESGISLFGNSDKPFVYKYLYPSIIHPAKGIIQALTIYMVVAVSAERYKAVCHPLR